MAICNTTSFLILFSFLVHFANGVYAKSHPYNVDFIYQFGDSLSDTGNLIIENPVGGYYFARPPYGQDFFHRSSTGRCSNGFLMIDRIAVDFKLPLLDPYLKKDGNFTHGVNFAVAGSTALDVATLAAKNISVLATNSSLSVQLNWFRSHLKSICNNRSGCKEKLKNALFMMGEIGGNDLNYALVENKSMEELQNLVPEIVQTIQDAVKEVIRLGATKVVVPGNFPIGCMPIYLANFKADPSMYDELHCLKGLNGLARFHNDQLQAAIKDLQQEFPNVSIIYGDYYNGLKQLISFAPLMGFDKDSTTKACCGSGNNTYNFNMTGMCGSEEARVCSNPYTHVHWDGIHLTSHAYFHVAKNLFDDIVRGISRDV